MLFENNCNIIHKGNDAPVMHRTFLVCTETYGRLHGINCLKGVEKVCVGVLSPHLSAPQQFCPPSLSSIPPASPGILHPSFPGLEEKGGGAAGRASCIPTQAWCCWDGEEQRCCPIAHRRGGRRKDPSCSKLRESFPSPFCILSDWYLVVKGRRRGLSLLPPDAQISCTSPKVGKAASLSGTKNLSISASWLDS